VVSASNFKIFYQRRIRRALERSRALFALGAHQVTENLILHLLRIIIYLKVLPKEIAPQCYDHPGHGQATALAGEISIAQALFFAPSPPRARVMTHHAAGGDFCNYDMAYCVKNPNERIF